MSAELPAIVPTTPSHLRVAVYGIGTPTNTEQQRTTMEYTQRNSKEDVNTLTKKYEPNGYGATVNKEQQPEPNQ